MTDIRNGCVNDDDRNVLLTRLGTIPEPVNRPSICFPSTSQADALNDMRLFEINEEPHEYFAEAAGPVNLVERLKKTCLPPNVCSSNRGCGDGRTQRRDHQFVNGSLGTVRGFAAENKADGRSLNLKTAISLP